MEEDILEESLQDIHDDFEELLYLFSSSLKQLQTFQKDLKRQKKHIVSYELLSEQIQQYENTYKTTLQELKLLFLRQTQDRNDKYTETKEMLKQVQHDISQVQKYRDLYRSLQPITAGIITATDWQSPTFDYSVTSLAGKQTGKITPNYDDYKRDQHADAKKYAEKFRSEYIDAIFKFSIPTYVTNSGMAALTTIINFLQMNKKISGPVLLGSSSYFQNKELVKKLFSNVTEIHEHETKKILNFIKDNHPSVIFFDSLCNSYDIAVPDLGKIAKVLREIPDHVFSPSIQTEVRDAPSTSSGQAKRDIYLVIDNTCLGPSFQPLQLLGKFPKHIHIIVFESLNKYYQFGIDRTMGGIIYTYGRDMNMLFYAIQHSGTILSDTGCYLLPLPNRKILTKRLSRHQRNALIIIEALHEFIQKHPHSPLQKIVYPNQNTHLAYSWSKSLSFYGSYFTFQWKKESISFYKRFIKTVLQEAKKQRVQLVQGTSFGMNTSRIYLTASNTKFGKPFVRLSLGTESRQEIENVKHVLLTAIEKL